MQQRGLPPRHPITGIILAGGDAKRFGGRAKGLERVGDARIIDRVATTLRPICDRLLIVSNDPGASGWLPGVEAIPDHVIGAGPAAGIQAALRRSSSPIVALAWDMPFVPASLLWELAEIGTETGADAVVPESDARHGVEPLCAYYAHRCLEHITGELARGERSLARILAAMNTVTLHRDRVARHGDPAVMLSNVNTPQELLVAQGLAASARKP